MDSPLDSTRLRLLNSAAEAFAEHGFEDATVRQMLQAARRECSAGQRSVSAISWSFIPRFLRFSLQPCPDRVRVELPPDTIQPAAALRLIVGAMIERAFETGDQANLRFRLMLNEFVRPSAATVRVVDVVMRPVYDRLREIVGEILGLPPNHKKTRLCVHSVLGQVAHFAHAKPVLGLLVTGDEDESCASRCWSPSTSPNSRSHTSGRVRRSTGAI